MKKSLLCVVGYVIIVSVLSANSLLAQGGVSNYQPLNWYASNKKPTFQYGKKISLDIQGLPLREALKEIEKAGNVQLVYVNELIPNKRVTMKLKDRTVVEALNLAIYNTNLELLADGNGQIIIKPKNDTQKEDSVANSIKQGVTLSGIITDSHTGDAIPGVNIYIVELKRGAATDVNGKYEIDDMPAGTYTVQITYIGYEKVMRTVQVADQNVTLNIKLGASTVGMKQLVVMGYGSQQKKNVTGSVASIPVSRINNLPYINVESSLEGQLAGVTVQQSNGAPGAGPTVRVRGVGSISAGNEPLYVIDGFPVIKNTSTGVQGDIGNRRVSFRPPPQDPLATINPNDIASIQVLKDASAAAIYGSRGSNGVVIITTKRGSRGKETQINVTAHYGIQQVAHKLDLMNPQQLGQYVVDSRNNNYLSSVPGASASDLNSKRNNGFYMIPTAVFNYDGTPVNDVNTDWQNVIFSAAPTSDMNISAAGGGSNFDYYFSGEYYNQNGIIDGSNFKRYSFHTNVDADLNSRINIKLNINPSYAVNRQLPANFPYFATPPGIVYSAIVTFPNIPAYNSDGTIHYGGQTNIANNGAGPNLGAGVSDARNPLAIMQAIDDQLGQFQTFGNLTGTYKITPELLFKSHFGMNYNSYRRKFYRSSELPDRNQTQIPGTPYGQDASSSEINWLWENTISYDHTINDVHSISAVVGYTAQKDKVDITQTLAQNFPDDLVHTISGGQVVGGTGTIQEWTLVSSLARLIYSYKDTYLITATIRSDRSSRFGKNNRTGLFPSGSIGWRIMNEKFMQNQKLFNELKLRASYGITGNNTIPNYGSIGLLGPTNYVLGGSYVGGTAPTTFSNPNLGWEKNYELDVGLDMAIFNDRIALSADHYISHTKDLLLQVNIPSSLGFSTALQNIGEVENKGWEFTLDTKNVEGSFQWNTHINFDLNHNKVLKLGPNGAPILVAGGAGVRNITQIGSPIGSYYGYKVVGVYQSEADIKNSPVDKLAPNPAPGDFKFADVNGDGVIDSNDRTTLGSYIPDFSYGITNEFYYKNFDLRVLIQGVYGNKILNLTSRHMKNGEANFNSYAIETQRWRSASQPGNGSIPRADRQSDLHGNNNRPSSFQVEDGSYLRLRNVTFGYTLPGKWIKNTPFSRIRFYLSGSNLITHTAYLGFNPEVNARPGEALTAGEDYGAYPISRIYTAGINISFK